MNVELRNLINALSPESFRILIMEMNKEKYNTHHVRIIDGPYDGGNDLEIFIGEKDIKRNIQVTVQKTDIEKKVKSDLEKSKENIQTYGYLNKMDYYISQNVSKEMRNSLETMAEIEYDIDLTIIDAGALANDSEIYKSIVEVVYKAHKIDKNGGLSKIISKESKILFDVLTSNKNTVEIRKNLIYSFIYSFLINNPNSSLEEIHSSLNTNFHNNLDINFLFKEINILKSKGQIISPIDKSHFQLSDEKKNEIEIIQERVRIQEHHLSNEINDFIITHNITCTVEDLIDKINKIYVENYKIDIDEMKNTTSSFSASLKKSFIDLQRFLEDHNIPKSNSPNLAKEILTKCSEKDYLNKIATTSLFTNLYNSNKLDEYINNKVLTVVLDTQILIRLLCIYYKENFQYKDSALSAVQSLDRAIKSNATKLKLVTTWEYVQEVAGHIQEAMKLQRFLNLPFVRNLGVSKNVYFNFYRELKESSEIENDMEFFEFIDEMLGSDFGNYDDRRYIIDVTERLRDLFDVGGIDVIIHPVYDNFSRVKKDYENNLTYTGKNRSSTAIDNDLKTIFYLSTPDNHIEENNGQTNEPFLLTWDSEFYSFRKLLLGKYPQLSYWYIYSPLKFIDRLSIMTFKISPSAITHNVVALAETNFNYSTRKASFFDVISNFFNQKDVSNLSILKKLADLRAETQDLDATLANDDNIYDEQEGPITTILIKIKNHYTSFEEKNTFSDVIKVFEEKDNEELILNILKEAILNYKSDVHMRNMYFRINNLIEKK